VRLVLHDGKLAAMRPFINLNGLLKPRNCLEKAA